VSKPVATTEVIRADEAYSRDEFLRRVGIGDWGFTKAKSKGLRVSKIGNKVFIRGADWLDHLERNAR
jgi:hypothetical protein